MITTIWIFYQIGTFRYCSSWNRKAIKYFLFYFY